jgi:DNA-binding transcriptional MerR regulator
MEELTANLSDYSEIPDKLYFRIGEVAKLAGIKPYVLRFWESEFRTLGPKKSGKGHRLYRRKDVVLVLEIKRLLYERRYTIAGAKKILESPSKRPDSPAAGQIHQKELFAFSNSPAFQEVRRELNDLLCLLNDSPRA